MAGCGGSLLVLVGTINSKSFEAFFNTARINLRRCNENDQSQSRADSLRCSLIFCISTAIIANSSIEYPQSWSIDDLSSLDIFRLPSLDPSRLLSYSSTSWIDDLTTFQPRVNGNPALTDGLSPNWTSCSLISTLQKLTQLLMLDELMFLNFRTKLRCGCRCSKILLRRLYPRRFYDYNRNVRTMKGCGSMWRPMMLCLGGNRVLLLFDIIYLFACWAEVKRH